MVLQNVLHASNSGSSQNPPPWLQPLASPTSISSAQYALCLTEWWEHVNEVQGRLFSYGDWTSTPECWLYRCLPLGWLRASPSWKKNGAWLLP